MKQFAAFAALLFGLSVAGEASADCTSFAGQAVASIIEPSIVKLQTIGTHDFTGNGTGFVVSSGGLVITAKHVVPSECSDETIVGQVENDAHIYRFQVVERSGLDIAVLQVVDPGRIFPALKLLRPIADQPSYRGKDVAIASFYPEYPTPVTTTARIDSTVVIGDANVWGLCAVAANQGRSGSPVVLSDGSVAAVFIERPGGEEDIARVLPIADVTDISVFTAAPAKIQFVSAPGDPAVISSPQQLHPLLYDLHLEASVAAHRDIRDGSGRYIFKGSGFEPASSLSVAELAIAAIGGGKVRYEDTRSQTFDAPDNYAFDPSVFSLRVSSHNPMQAPLPVQACSGSVSQDCYAFSGDARHLTVHFRIFAGPVGDAAHGWLDSSISTRLVPLAGA